MHTHRPSDAAKHLFHNANGGGHIQQVQRSPFALHYSGALVDVAAGCCYNCCCCCCSSIAYQTDGRLRIIRLYMWNILQMIAKSLYVRTCGMYMFKGQHVHTQSNATTIQVPVCVCVYVCVTIKERNHHINTCTHMYVHTYVCTW